MKRTLLCTLFVVLGLLVLTGCSNAMKEYAGTYELEYQKYVGDPDTAKTQEVWTIVLNEDGTGKSNRNGASYNVEWSVSGDEIKLSEVFGTIANEFNGTIRGARMDIFNGDKTQEITLEAVFNKQ